MKDMYDNNLVSIKTLSQAQSSFANARVQIRDMNTVSSREDKDKYAALIQVSKQDVKAQMDSYRNTILTKPELDELQNFDIVYPEFIKLFDAAYPLAYEEENSEFDKYKQEKLIPAGNKVRDSISKLIDVNVKLAEQTNIKAGQDFASSRFLTGMVIVISFVFSLLLGYGIAQSIARPFNRIVSLVTQVAEGNLRNKSDISGKDEVDSWQLPSI